MASILSLVAGLVIGLIAGWFIRGSRGAGQPAATPAEPAAAPSVATPSEAQPSVDQPSVDQPSDTAEAVTTADLTSASSDATDTALLTLDAEPANEETAIIASEPADAPADSDPTAATQVISAADAATATEAEPVEAVAPTDTVPIAATETEPFVADIEPAAITEPAAAAAEPEPIAVAAEPEPVAVPESIAVAEPEPVVVTAVTEPASADLAPALVPAGGLAGSGAADAMPAPGVTEPDDLTRINGIGPKMAMALAAAGITTFRKLADSDVATVRAAITGAGMRLAPTVATWPERAKLFADTAA